MATTELDKRVHAYRPDLADAALRGKVAAERFTTGEPACVTVPVAGLYRRPSRDAPLDTQAVLGEPATIFERGDTGWNWVQLGHDGYVGWMESRALADDHPEPTHRISVSRTLLFSEPDIKSPLLEFLPLGAAVRVVADASDDNAEYGLVDPHGAIVKQHLLPVRKPLQDFVAVAEQLLGTPYLWGGSTAFGIDCSALVQIAQRMTGRNIPRDSDMQEASVGTLLAAGPVRPDLDEIGLRRGDLVFWKGHVGIMQDATNLLHANAHHMAVASEPLIDAVERIASGGLDVTSIRRP